MKCVDIFKILVAVALLVALLPMPLCYFSFLKCFVAISMLLLAVIEFCRENQAKSAFSMAFAVLFQPFYTMGLGKIVWWAVDLLLAVWLIVDVKRAKSDKKN